MVYVLDEDRVTGEGGLWGSVLAGNPLRTGFAGAIIPPRVIGWTGWIGDGPAEAAERDFRAWGPGAWAGLTASLRAALPACEDAGVKLVLRPHARHVVSDAQRWVKLREEFPWLGLLLDPVSLMSSEMMGRAEEHLARMASALAPGAEAVLVSDAAPGEDGLLHPVPWGRGVLPREWLVRLARACGGARITRPGDTGAGSALRGEEA
jgi:sugar phosphate isomerase/epimerase